MLITRSAIASKLLLVAIASVVYTAAIARQDSTRYALILDFYSIGTGTPGDQPLKDFVTTYRKKNKLKPLAATRVGGLGREGEYAIVFPLKELTIKQKQQFISAISKALPNLKTKDEMGGIHLNQDQPFDVNRGRIKAETIAL